MIQPGGNTASKGQSGPVRTALFASGRALYPVVLAVTVVLMLAAVELDDALHPPLWLHALIWPPVVVAVMIGTLRLCRRGGSPVHTTPGDDAPQGDL